MGSTHMNKKTAPDIGTRIRQLAAEISAIAEFAEGSIKKTASTYATKDGTRNLCLRHHRQAEKRCMSRRIRDSSTN